MRPGVNGPRTLTVAVTFCATLLGVGLSRHKKKTHTRIVDINRRRDTAVQRIDNARNAKGPSLIIGQTFSVPALGAVVVFLVPTKASTKLTRVVQRVDRAPTSHQVVASRSTDLVRIIHDGVRQGMITRVPKHGLNVIVEGPSTHQQIPQNGVASH
jgi:hypothetical protein